MAVSRIKTSSVLQGFPKSRSLLAGNTAYDPAATWLIQRTSPSGGTTSITFSSIPQTYKHLQIRAIARDTSASAGSTGYALRLNADGGTNYTWHRLNGNGTSVTAAGSVSQSYLNVDQSEVGGSSPASVFAASIIDLHDCTSTTKNKTVRHIAGDDMNGSGDIWLGSDLWINTSAINQITMFCSGIFAAGSTFALYGIKGA